MTIPGVILIAFNPRAGAADRRDLLNSLQIRLEDMGFDVQMVGELTDLEVLAAEYRENGRLRMVVSAGGDGTLAAVAQRTHPDTCLAVFPLGTENLMAKWSGATIDLDKFSAAVKANRTRSIDAAMANGRLALITIGIGFDAEVVRLVHTNRTGHITKWSYAWPILRTIWNYGFPQFRVTMADWQDVVTGQANSLPKEFEVADIANETRSWSAPWVFVANLPLYAGGLSIIPHAKPSDGLLDIACFTGSGRIRGLLYALWIALRRHTRCCDYSAFRAKKITIDSPAPSGYQLDGDYGGELPLEIRIQPDRIKLLSFNRQDVSLND
ncbi:MAG: diacylglycerol kinase family protein [Pirellulaceae bacterium]|nr:diacylglycerol kinase family protein [Pirellulaceae bacterium]